MNQLNFTPNQIKKQIMDTNLSKLVKPQYLDSKGKSIPNVKVTSIEFISLDDIESSDVDHNIGRFHGTNEVDTKAMKLRYLQFGYTEDMRLPAVYRMGDSLKPFTFKRVNGFHRDDACDELGIEVYPHAVLEFSGTEDEQKLAKMRVGLNDNDDYHTPPKIESTEKDVIMTVQEMVHCNLILNTEENINDEVLKCKPSLSTKKSVLNRVVSQIMSSTQTPGRKPTWSLKKALDWKKRHVHSETYEFSYGLDSARDEYGVLVGDNQDYIDRAIFKAMELHNETGRKTYIIGHVGDETKSMDTIAKRISFRNKLAKRLGVIEKYATSKFNSEFISILGFMPQIQKTENWGGIIK